jgi:Ala-tRNA(Pro) deacylase
MNTEDLIRTLEHKHLGYELLPHPSTITARAEADVVGVPPDQVAKTIVLSTAGGYMRAVVAASERLDLHKVRELIGVGKAARLATEAELAGAYPMFELGAVPPFGGPVGDRTIFDRRLAEQDAVVVEAGSHSASVRIKTQDLVALTNAELVDICVD